MKPMKIDLKSLLFVTLAWVGAIHAAPIEGWSRLSNGLESTVQGSIVDATLWDDGSGPAVVITGSFLFAGNEQVHHVARWNGVSFRPLGGGLGNSNGTHYGNKVISFRNKLIAAGSFSNQSPLSPGPARNIAQWDGQSWIDLANGVNGEVRSMVVFNNELWVAGTFTQAGTQAVNKIARWNGNSWLPVGGSFEGIVQDMIVYNNELYLAADGLYRFDGENLQLIAAGSTPGGFVSTVLDLEIYQNELIVSGRFTDFGTSNAPVSANRVARFDGTTWRGLGSGVASNTATALAEARNIAVYGGELYASGYFTFAGGTAVKNIARWNGTVWRTVGVGMDTSGPNTPVSTRLLSAPDGLWIMGEFQRAGTTGARRLARWDGTDYRPITQGFSNGVRTSVIHNGMLVVGGDFLQAGNTAVNHVARWNGSTWEALGAGFNGTVKRLRVIDGELYAAGDITRTGFANLHGLAKWNGTSWQSVGTQLFQGVATDIGKFNNKLVMTGNIATQVAYVGELNGSTWSTLGTGSGFWITPSALTMHNAELYVDRARWNGTTFVSLDANGIGEARASISSGGNLYIGKPDGLEVFNGTTLSSVAPPNGINLSEITALANFNGDLLVGGSVQSLPTSSQPNRNWIIRYAGTIPNPIEVNRGGLASAPGGQVSSLIEFQNRIIAGGFIQEAGGGVAGPYISAYGPTDSTQTIIQSIASAQTGQPTVISARISASVAPTAGAVMIDGAPSGACVATQFTVINATTSEASCSITYNRGGPQQLTARYTGAALNNQSWQGSQSAPLIIDVLQDFIFADGFE
jgi:hypothetical protein